MAKQKYLTKEQLAIINPYCQQHHYMTTAEWIRQCFEIQCDSTKKPIIVPGHQIINENGIITQQQKYKIKRKAELWMMALVIIMDYEMAVRTAAFLNKEKKGKVNDFAFYGSYSRIRSTILSAVDPKLVPQLSRSITVRSISTSMRRAEKSGFIKIEHNAKAKECSITNYRRITINYDKLMELSEFNLDKHKRSDTWKKYHSSSREHRWLRKRPVSYLKPLIDDLADKNKKEVFREKLEALKLKLKNHQDVFKAFILNNQKMYKTSPMKNLTTIKSIKDQSDEVIQNMYKKHDQEDLVLSYEQQALLQGVIAQMV